MNIIVHYYDREDSLIGTYDTEDADTVRARQEWREWLNDPAVEHYGPIGGYETFDFGEDCDGCKHTHAGA